MFQNLSADVWRDGLGGLLLLGTERVEMRGRHILGLAWPAVVTVSILINGVSEDNERSIITINLHSTYPPRIQPIPIPISNEDPAQPRWSLIFRLFGTTAGLIYQIKCHKIRRNLIICISLLPHSSKGWGYTAGASLLHVSHQSDILLVQKS